MEEGKKTGQLYVIIFITAVLLFLSPLINVGDYPSLVGGFPRIFVYIFISWAAIIGLLYVASKHKESKE